MGEEEFEYVEVTKRSIIKFGGSRAITLPKKWIDFLERVRKRRIDEIYTLMDEVVIIAPEERVEEFKEFLKVWSRLTPEERKALLKLAESMMSSPS